MTPLNRRSFLKGAAAGALAVALPARTFGAQPDLQAIRKQIEKHHEATVKRLQSWVRQPSIAAENRGMEEGCQLMIELAKEAGFQQAAQVATAGHPGVLATLDAGASRTVGLYFMYDVKQVDPSEWSSPPWEAALVDKPGLGKVMMGRGTVNQKGPQYACLAAIQAIRSAGVKLPVNLVLVAEGEEEIGSPHFSQVVQNPKTKAALAGCSGILMPSASQGLDGIVTVTLGAKGVVELELICTGEKWGRGPGKDVHSANKARLDSPVWRLVQALHTLVSPDGNQPAIEGFADRARPISSEEKAMVKEGARRMDEAQAKKLLAVERCINDVGWEEALERLVSKPTVNIEGLVAGYTGPGGKTVLPHKAVAKLDLRLVPDMTAAGAQQALREHLAKRGFGDLEVHVTGGYDPSSTPAASAFIRAQVSAYRRRGIDPLLWPRSAGSWPGCVFTGDPLRLPAGHFGLGHGSGAHGPDEYYLIESTNPKLDGIDGAALSFAEYFFEIASA